MSGGYFQYKQYELNFLRDQIEDLINKSNNKDEYYTFSKETIDTFKHTVDILKEAEFLTHRIDWLVSSDDSEETFHKLIEEWNKNNEV